MNGWRASWFQKRLGAPKVSISARFTILRSWLPGKTPVGLGEALRAQAVGALLPPCNKG